MVWHLEQNHVRNLGHLADCNYEVESKIFWTGAASYTAVVVARSAGRW